MFGGDNSEDFERVAAAVDADRHWERHMQIARIGATDGGGVDRQALSREDAKARRRVSDWAAEIGCTAFVDPIGNLFFRRPGLEADAAPVLSGSHLDSQPKGGRFDGTYGVLAALEVLAALRDAGVETRRPIEAVVWTNEEGSRFLPPTMGSQTYREPDALDRMLASRDANGNLLADALRQTVSATPEAVQRELGGSVHAYVENHIEQGPRLEDAGKVIGVVTGIQGGRKFVVDVVGEAMHAGTTPRRRRKDALLAATAMVQALDSAMHDPQDVLRCTVGRFEVEPGAPSVVPGRVTFSVDVRHPDPQELARRGDAVPRICRKLRGPCEVHIDEPQSSAPVIFEGRAVEAVRAAVARLGVPAMDLPSGAGHDARHLHHLCPTAMIFVPCADGISHNERESAEPEHLVTGTRVLAQALLDLANS